MIDETGQNTILPSNEVAMSLQPSSAVQNSIASDGDVVPNTINPLGESAQPAEANETRSGSDQSEKPPPTFWQMSASELFSFVQTRNPALKSELIEETFTSYDLSTANLFSMLTIETKDQIFSEMGIDPTQNLLKSLLIEKFFTTEIQADQSVPIDIRNYWSAYHKSKFQSSPLVSPSQVHFGTPIRDHSSEQPIKKLCFGESPPSKTLSIPGVATPIQTPSFYKHIQGSTNSFFHVLEKNIDTPLNPASILRDQSGNIQLQINMLPAPTVIHTFPTLAIFSKLTIPNFLLEYKMAKLSAPSGAKKTLKNCINPLIWSNVARICEVDLDTFEKTTNDQTIYASLLRRFGPTTEEQAIDLLKAIKFNFDDSKTPQEHFSGELSTHFTKFREQLTQFLFCEFEKGEELSPDACLMCLKDAFTHNPFIKGPDGKTQVRKSSNNSTILEKIHLFRHDPIHEIMSKIELSFEKDDKSSRRKGFNIVPWNTKESNQANSKPQFQRGAGIQKDSRPFVKMDRCCKCGRFHAPSIETCILFDHPTAGKETKWPEGQVPLTLETPELWNAWLDEKEKSQPKLVQVFKKKSKERKSQGQGQGGQGHLRGGGAGKPPRHPGNNNKRANNGRFVNNNQYLSLNSMGLLGNEDDELGALHGHANSHETSDEECACEQPHVTASSKNLNLEDISEETFFAIARFRKGKNEKTGKKLPSTRRDKALRVLMDSGSQANFINEEALTKGKLLIIESSDEIKCQITQNEAPMGDVCRRCVYLRFTLDLLRKSEAKYEDWFIVSKDVKYDAVLGTKFSRQHGYTSFHSKLVPWSREMPSDNNPKSEDENIEKEKIKRPSPSENSKREFKDDDVELTDEELKEKQNEFDAAMTDVPTDMFNKFGSKHPVHGRPIIRNPNLLPPETVVHRGAHASMDNLQKMEHECRDIIAKKQYHSLCKTVKILSENRKAQDNFMSAEEVENAIKTEKQAAEDVEIFFRNNEHLLRPKDIFVPSKKFARYFEPIAFNAMQAANSLQVPVAVPVAPTDGPTRIFTDNQMVLLTGLVNHADLNGTPARIMSYDSESNKYTISIAKPRGYWLIQEQFMKAIETVKKGKSDIGPQELGIDPESGQPTLDPLQRPVHRQYGNFFSRELTSRIAELLEKYKQIFSTDVTEPCNFKSMKIKLKPNAILPRNARLWKNSPLIRAEIRRQLQKMIDMKIVTKSSSAIVSNVLMVKRPGMPGKYRFTVDFRAINDATESEPWQMPDVQDQLSRLKGKNIFGCVDASSYYHQITMHEESRYLTGFVTEDGVYEYARVPMGVKNACAHAQRELQMALDDDPVLRKFGIRNYFDDIPLAADTPEEFLELLTALFELALRFKIKFNLEKSIFGVDSITHCGFIVSAKGVQIDPMRTQSIREMEEPKSLKKVQAVLGTLNYVRHFIKDFSLMAKPLTDLLSSKSSKNARQFCWTESCSKAFHAIKQAALDAPLLEVIDFEKEVFIRCDSSQFGQGAVLFQFDEQGREHVIAYASRKYSLSERNWATFQQEASAIVWALEKFHEFIGGHPVIVQTDHKNLSWISKSIMPQLTRWRLRLQDFDFTVEFVPGRLNEVSDGLSRIHVDDDDIPISMRDFLPPAAAAASFLNESVPMRCLNNYRVGTVQHGKPSKTKSELIWEAKSVTRTEGGTEHDSDEEKESAVLEQPRHDERFRNMMGNDDDLAALEVDEDSDSDDEEVINAQLPNPPGLEGEAPRQPEQVRQIIESVHGDIIGHGGTYVTLQRVLRHKQGWASRSKMLSDIDQFLTGCSTCQKFKKRHNNATNQRFFIEGSPFAEISVDILHLPKADCYGNQYVVVIVDSFTRFTFAVPVADKTAINAGRAVLQSIGIFGAPITIRSDGGGEFVGDIIKSIEVMTSVKHHRIQPYLHTGNSIVERTNRSILEHMRTLIWDKRLDFNGEHMWSDILPLACRIINASFNSSIGCSPCSLLFGENVDMDRCILSAPPRPCKKEAYDYAAQLSANQRVLLEASEKFQSTLHAKQLTKWRQSQKPNNIVDLVERSEVPGNEVVSWVVAKVLADSPHNKLKPRWSGPFMLMGFKQDSKSMVKLWDTVDRKVREAPINNIAEWKCDLDNSVEGLTHIRQTDYSDLAYPMEAILGVALDPKDETAEPVPLDANYVRTKPKENYVFSVKWRGYHEPTWRPYRVVKRTSLFPLFVASRPNLNL